MAKKSWFTQLKRFFNPDTRSKQEKLEKRRRWVFGRVKIKRLASVSAPISQSRERPDNGAEEEQRHHDTTVDIATAVSAEVVSVTGVPQSVHQCGETADFLAVDVKKNPPRSTQRCERKVLDLAATRIQTAFRGYLARKALSALKGLVRLQAIIRGRAVRRQAITALKCLQSVVTIQSQVCARRFQMVEGTRNSHENKNVQDFKDKIESDRDRRWDDSLLSKDDAKAIFLSKREAAIKRERIKEYTLSHRRSTESENKVDGRWRYWLDQWVDTQLSKNSDTAFPSNVRIREEYGAKLKPRNSHRPHHIEDFELDPPISIQRRSFHHKKQNSVGNDTGFPSSPIVPTYMAATESAKAKLRSMSSPRLRRVNFDAYSESNSPYKHKLSPKSSINSEVTSSSRVNDCNFSGVEQISPCLKGFPRPVKSNRSLKDLSFDSECSFPNWARNGSSR
ncbi:protein IQ-DOMAIN 11 [Rhododendron vialii]|uniref:protein IQ-DOMAIN 11 n=1 Tax=Rhododendron vialii TaxID=182163 RepID=UPI00266008EC|nr:protein IQ-DOMAIN 11 [Rhododendron vialii]XP_058225882.1 protein IQ-DOMAIN 11 [Rhododendron vialii]XP_058225883.1 protein IQ-DOMAIN 11 [Rhododendron vialii]XP_058225884.1 protein IQ-DOMAIN 11 [Rhododendron vialii]XP_058225885.1 protein IQ-DOMAIN 11 [Rhododendron vialii]XP_058225886.1 protein IQ-DOMAIN 11 [Rhododendron vialii]XP_058225887.1 protein IQ-DOMAIN 11 [Rhododendron vialii]XP_058225888.1 protein IQ-DOMAIN 11 [Rhododendron vialii]